MIRIDLLRSYRRGRRRILVAAAVVAVVAGTGLASLGRRGGAALFPVSWGEVFGRGGGEDVPVAAPVHRPPVPRPDGQGAPVPAPAAPAPENRPRQGRACRQLLELGARLPGPLRLGNLVCNAAGEYRVEGTAPMAQVGQLHTFLDSLRHLPSQASLSFWREGKRQEEQVYKFAFQGRFPEPGPFRLEPQTAEEAAALFGQVVEWARRGGLELLAVEELPPEGAAGSRQERQKIRVMGSSPQLIALADSLHQVEVRLGLDELVLVAVYQEEKVAPRVQLSAVLQALVPAPASLP